MWSAAASDCGGGGGAGVSTCAAWSAGSGEAVQVADTALRAQRRVIALAISCGFALYLGAVFRGPHLPRLLMHTALVMAVGSQYLLLAVEAWKAGLP